MWILWKQKFNLKVVLQIFGPFIKSPTELASRHTLVRNYLMMCLAVSNAHRTTRISNLMVSDMIRDNV